MSAARKALGTRKIGHAGTLDPMATGLLVLGVGTSTRLLTYLVGADKTYTATIRLGSATVTDDAEGDVIFTADHNVLDAITDDEIQKSSIQNKLMFFLWDSVFNRDKKPLVKLLFDENTENELITFGDFAKEVDLFIEKINGYV